MKIHRARAARARNPTAVADTEREIERHPLRNYRMTVAAQVAEEARARSAAEPGPCLLCPYLGCLCLQHAAALAELPLRCACHGCLFGGAALCAPEAAEHHRDLLNSYRALAELLCGNLLWPCAPTPLHVAEYSLLRPSKPRDRAPPGETCCERAERECLRACGECCERAFCDCDAALAIGMRRVRALLCVLGGIDACDRAVCCGPVGPCGSGEAQLLARWAAEHEGGRRVRTLAFYAQAEAQPARYAFFEDVQTGEVTVSITDADARARCWGRGRAAPPPPVVGLRMERADSYGPGGKEAQGGGSGGRVVQGLRPIRTRFATPAAMRAAVEQAVAGEAGAGSTEGAAGAAAAAAAGPELVDYDAGGSVVGQEAGGWRPLTAVGAWLWPPARNVSLWRRPSSPLE